ncbi:MAG: VanZ family protein [Syntrophales bacterium]|jgi:VanZ family protein|nr:VanZ family protein [Syntrophales bacterium]MDY0044499.1 VanZ family protein [Syntrophales bacterium]
MNNYFLKWNYFYLVPSVCYGILIFILSSISRYPESVPSFWGFDKVLHLTVYFIFGFLLARMCANSPWRGLNKKYFLISVTAGILYGITDEWHQSFVPGRTATIADALFDSLGIVLGVFSYRAVKGRRPVLNADRF